MGTVLESIFNVFFVFFGVVFSIDFRSHSDSIWIPFWLPQWTSEGVGGQKVDPQKQFVFLRKIKFLDLGRLPEARKITPGSASKCNAFLK